MKQFALSYVFLVLALAGCRSGSTPSTPSSPVATPAKPELKLQTRDVWTGDATPCIRQWLICGVFPIDVPKDGWKDGCGLAVDYLAAAGGEAKARPAEGQEVKRPDGSIVRWTKYQSAVDIIEGEKAFPDQPDKNVVGYAYATIESPKAQRVTLGIGTDDGCRVWLNGKLIDEVLAGRACNIDDDLIVVDLQAGTNSLLLKIEQGSSGIWGWCARVLDSPLPVLTRYELFPSILPADEKHPNDLAVRTDVLTPGVDDLPIQVEVLTGAGKSVAAQKVARGVTATFKADGWADGPYEVRISTNFRNGRPQAKHLWWYKGDFMPAARQLMGIAKPKPELAVLADKVRAETGGPDNPKKANGGAVAVALMEFQELQPTTVPTDPRIRPAGFVRLAWRDEVDDSVQYCRAYLPAGYDPAKKWPMVVNLHGYNGQNPPYIYWWGSFDRYHWLAETFPIVVIEPHGRYNTGYRGIGDRDVVRCIEEAKKKLSIDEDRILLTGYSMGGGGTWHVGIRHPELFAAIAPIYGGWDYHSEDGFTAESVAKMTDRERFRTEQWSSFAGAESLVNMPILINHGDIDAAVNVEHSRYVTRMLQRWGYNVRYWEHPGLGHGMLNCERETMRWFLSQKRDATPAQVRIRASWLRDASAYWVKVQQKADPFQFILVDAEIIAPNVVRLDTKNVLEATISPAGPMIDAGKPLQIIWNGKVHATSLAGGSATLRDPDYKPAGMVKKPSLDGGIAHAAQTPFALVIGTISPDATMRGMCQYRADRVIRAWENWQHVRPRVFRDTDMSPEDMARYTLLLIGGPAENAVARALAERIPLKIEKDKIIVDGKEFAAPDAGIQLIYPNPLNPERYVLVSAGTSAKGLFFADRTPDDVDFVIHDGRIADDDAGRPWSKVCIASGFLDNAWHWSDAFIDVGDPAIRAKSAIPKAPRYFSANVDAPSLALSDLAEAGTNSSFDEMTRGLARDGNPITIAGKTFADGLSAPLWDSNGSVDFDVSAGQWKHLRATVGTQIKDPTKLTAEQKKTQSAVFVVLGDGKELFRSPAFAWDSKPLPIDVDVTGVKKLTLAVKVTPDRFRIDAAHWAEVRVEK